MRLALSAAFSQARPEGTAHVPVIAASGAVTLLAQKAPRPPAEWQLCKERTLPLLDVAGEEAQLLPVHVDKPRLQSTTGL